VWKRTVEGRTLTFHLAGINNQNFLMRDEETGSYWQQINGLAVSGPLSGKQLELVDSDELTFALWKSEEPDGFVLKPVMQFAKEYDPKHWDVRMAKAKTVIDFPGSGLKPRELVLGIHAFGASRAFPMELVKAEKLVEDRVGTEPVLLLLGPDGESVRAFQARTQAGMPAPDFYRTAAEPEKKMDAQAIASAAQGPVMLDSAGSSWNFHGCALSGPLTGTCLKPVYVIKDYWFDWRNYNPRTTFYKNSPATQPMRPKQPSVSHSP
jgi:hypothetical protein